MTVYRLPTRHTREHQEEEVPSHPNGIYEHGTVSAKPWLCSASADAHAVTAIQHDLTAKKLLSLHYPSTELDPTLVERLCGIAYTRIKLQESMLLGPWHSVSRHLGWKVEANLCFSQAEDISGPTFNVKASGIFYSVVVLRSAGPSIELCMTWKHSGADRFGASTSFPH